MKRRFFVVSFHIYYIVNKHDGNLSMAKLNFSNAIELNVRLIYKLNLANLYSFVFLNSHLGKYGEFSALAVQNEFT
jgi:hypothetical protein